MGRCEWLVSLATRKVTMTFDVETDEEVDRIANAVNATLRFETIDGRVAEMAVTTTELPRVVEQ
jgi:hypothetical protein